ncbi:class I SAM-dependent methyltransferase [Dactylosporangium sp. NPDC049140]|uniref:class I SAM-dependent methyltransferase n=1 Tax=Dactylosporangium sp. NPDC049140 TaxID=3155647 RepID=UPI0033E70CD6
MTVRRATEHDAAALDRLRADGHAEAVLWVLASNERARRFYEAAGWHADGGSRIEDFAGVPIEELRYRRTVANGVWDEHAATFDDEPDHGLRDPSVRRAWSRLLASVLPPAPASIVDLGCGTGSLSVLAAGQGHRVVGLDGSAAMLRQARGKQPDLPLVRGDVSRPPFAPGSFDVVLVRHVLWAVPDPAATLARWFELGRRLVLIEGRWSTGAGLTAAECTALLRRLGRPAQVRPLTDEALWGKPVTDERYLLVDS